MGDTGMYAPIASSESANDPITLDSLRTASPIAMRTASLDLPLSRRAPSSRSARRGPISVVRASSAHLRRLVLYARRVSAARLSFLHFTAPHLSQYILELALDLIIPDGTPACPFPEWTPQCFARMNRLRTLYLDDVPGPWAQLSPPLARGISTLLAAPQLQTPMIQGWDFAAHDTQALLRMLSLCGPSLRDLTLLGVTACQLAGDDEFPSVTLVALSSLRLEFVDHPGLDASLIHCPNLRSITIRPIGLANVQMWIPSEVRALTLSSSPLTAIPKFAEDVRLTVLIINMENANLSESHEWVKGCINNLPSPTLLEELRIKFKYDRKEYSRAHQRRYSFDASG